MAMQKIRLTKQLRQVDSFRWSAWMLYDWIIIVICMTGAIYAEHWVAWCAATVVVGNRIHALGILFHDATHYLAFRNRYLNDIISNCFAGWLIGWTVEGYRVWHLKHHRHTGEPEDPELDYKLLDSPHWDLPLKHGRILFSVIRDFCGKGLTVVLAGFLMFPSPIRRHNIYAAVYPLTISSLLIYAGLWQVVALWYLSVATSFAVFMRLRMWLEHVGSDDTHRVHLGFWEAVCLAPHNTWYHWEHHEYPIVPFHHLPKLRELDTRAPVISLQELLKILFVSKPIPSGKTPGQVKQKPSRRNLPVSEREKVAL